MSDVGLNIFCDLATAALLHRPRPVPDACQEADLKSIKMSQQDLLNASNFIQNLANDPKNAQARKTLQSKARAAKTIANDKTLWKHDGDGSSFSLTDMRQTIESSAKGFCFQ